MFHDFVKYLPITYPHTLAANVPVDYLQNLERLSLVTTVIVLVHGK